MRYIEIKQIDRFDIIFERREIMKILDAILKRTLGDNKYSNRGLMGQHQFDLKDVKSHGYLNSPFIGHSL